MANDPLKLLVKDIGLLASDFLKKYFNFSNIPGSYVFSAEKGISKDINSREVE